MNKKTKIGLQKLAADILVAPLTAIAASKEMVKKYNESESGQKTKENIKKTGYRLSEAFKKAAEGKKGRKAAEKAEVVKDIAGKIGGVFTEGVGKVNEFLADVDQRADERMKEDEARTENEGRADSEPKDETVTEDSAAAEDAEQAVSGADSENQKETDE